jgi:hypothetical protein
MSLINLVGLPRFELGTSCTPSKRAGATGAIAFRYLTSHTACDSVKIAQTTVQSARYSAENHGIRKAAVGIAVVGAPTLEHYWEDGPQVTGWGSVVGKHPDGTPAIVEGTFGSGWVILSGVHPEAPERWRRGMSFNTPASVDNAYAAAMIQAALNRSSMANH